MWLSIKVASMASLVAKVVTMGLCQKMVHNLKLLILKSRLQMHLNIMASKQKARSKLEMRLKHQVIKIDARKS